MYLAAPPQAPPVPRVKMASWMPEPRGPGSRLAEQSLLVVLSSKSGKRANEVPVKAGMRSEPTAKMKPSCADRMTETRKLESHLPPRTPTP
eukprot:12403520-Alexandrium_andersonii.AAC.1